MTGFGNSTCLYGKTSITIDIKAINSKVLDFFPKIPFAFKDRESEIRSIISKLLERGKIDMVITVDESQDILEYTVDSQRVKIYYKDLKELADQLGIVPVGTDLLKMALRMPDIFTNPKNNIPEELWLELQKKIIEACNLVSQSREEEGKTLEKDFIERIRLIESYLEEIPPFEHLRMDLVKSRLLKQLAELKQKYDETRFEQELIYYIEKIDITEEKLRLKKHCEYFIETIKEESANGKKLSFISQEIGREINTLGSKAYEVNIQKLVVKMKDELEKIKEQLANVL
jgi:uncharacterized protein (TIGR00255 family)